MDDLRSLVTRPPDTQRVGRDIVVFDEIDSTNVYALAQGRDGQVIVADRQSAGRGRRGRSWHSAPGLGLWFTVVLEDAPEGLVFAAALAVRDAVAEASPTIKWPNDVLIGGRKVCGILAERRDAITALGIGINVAHAEDDFPPELRATAVSLLTQTGRRWDRAALLREVLRCLDERVMLIASGQLDTVHAEWSEACALAGKAIRFDGESGVVEAIEQDGSLRVNTNEGVRRLYAADISIQPGES